MIRRIKIACVGNSITEGSANDNPAVNSYTAQLQRLVGDEYEVGNFGSSGATLLSKGNLPYRRQEAYQKALAFGAEITIIKLGTNDTKPENWVFKEEFENDYTALIRSFQLLRSKPRIILLTPASIFRKAPDARNRVLEAEMVPLIKKIAAGNGCELLDLFSPTKSLGSYFPDGVHPNVEGTERLTRMIYDYLQK